MNIRIGVIGYGYWGPNLVRNFFSADGCWMTAVCDRDPEQLVELAKRYPTIKTMTDCDELIQDTEVDAVAIATPVSTHFTLAMKALKAGKHVLVEKPLTSTCEEAVQLIEEAEKRKLVLMVDHTFVYTDAVRWIRKIVSAGKLGKLYYYDSVRVNLGLFQHDVNVLWDLAPHDLAIMDYVLDRRPRAVSATGVANVPGQPESITYVNCFFDENLMGHFHVNWLAPVKVRNTLVCGDRRMIVYNDLEPSEKVKIYDKGVRIQEGAQGVIEKMISYRVGHMWAPRLGLTEALQTEVRHFLECIDQGRTPVTDGKAGLHVVDILEAASASMRRGGEQIRLKQEKGYL